MTTELPALNTIKIRHIYNVQKEFISNRKSNPEYMRVHVREKLHVGE